ncbi:hypothetical protein Aperf_G00000066103 [Anoplocephala perfoliata]
MGGTDGYYKSPRAHATYLDITSQRLDPPTAIGLIPLSHEIAVLAWKSPTELYEEVQGYEILYTYGGDNLLRLSVPNLKSVRLPIEEGAQGMEVRVATTLGKNIASRSWNFSAAVFVELLEQGPDIPIYVKLDHLDPFRALLTWQPPRKLNKKLMGYEILYKFDNKEKHLLQTRDNGYYIRIPKEARCIEASIALITQQPGSSEAKNVAGEHSPPVFLDLRSKSKIFCVILDLKF